MIGISFFSIAMATFVALWHLFLHWLSIFAAPVKEPEMFWIIIPIWINWFFAEFFQEKRGTSFGNAIQNGAIAILASIDWVRYMYRLLGDGAIRLTFVIFLKFVVSASVLFYGVYIIILGIRTNRMAYFIGKIRWVTYVLVMFTPLVYLSSAATSIRLDFYTLLSMVVFFPVYYWVIEIFDRITPEPRLYKEDSQ